MPNIRISLFTDSFQPFCEMLKSNQIEFTTQEHPPGAVMAAASAIEIFSGVGAVLAPLATVLVAWIRSKSSRKVMITTKKNEVIHVVQGMSVDEVERILEATRNITVIDTAAKAKK
jgi:hypothetical protein